MTTKYAHCLTDGGHIYYVLVYKQKRAAKTLLSVYFNYLNAYVLKLVSTSQLTPIKKNNWFEIKLSHWTLHLS